jgi:hypothetical protein
MADPIAVIIRFSGDRDDLLERFKRARQLWIKPRPATTSARPHAASEMTTGSRSKAAERARLPNARSVTRSTLISRHLAGAHEHREPRVNLLRQR